MSGGIGLTDPVEGWRQFRAELHREICEHGFNTEGNAFVQYYGGTEIDAALLMMAEVGFRRPTIHRASGG